MSLVKAAAIAGFTLENAFFISNVAPIAMSPSGVAVLPNFEAAL